MSSGAWVLGVEDSSDRAGSPLLHFQQACSLPRRFHPSHPSSLLPPGPAPTAAWRTRGLGTSSSCCRVVTPFMAIASTGGCCRSATRAPSASARLCDHEAAALCLITMFTWLHSVKRKEGGHAHMVPSGACVQPSPSRCRRLKSSTISNDGHGLSPVSGHCHSQAVGVVRG